MKENNKQREDLVSVIIPTHGRSSTLARAIKSVKNQTYKNIEIIVVDDNARDQSLRDKVSEIVNHFEGVKLYYNDKELGGSGSRNNGIKFSKGELLAFLDDDDEFLPTKIQKQYELYKQLENKKVGMIYCYSNFITESTNKIAIKAVDYEGIPLKEHLISCIAATSWWFCPKKALLDIGGFVDVSSHQDAMTLFKLMLAGYEVYRVPEVLLNYYWHPGSGITEHSNKWIDVDRQYMKEYLKIKDSFTKRENRDIQYSFYRRMTIYDYKLKNKRKLYSETKQMIKLKPLDIDTSKAIIRCIFSVFGA